MKQSSSSARKSQFTRTLDYFRNADIDEATACLQSATEVIVSRTTPPTPARHTRKVRTKVNGEALEALHQLNEERA